MDTSIFKDCVDRNRGILSITEEGINETRTWQEGRVIIDLDEEMYEEMKERFDSYSKYNEDLTHFSFEDLPDMVDMVQEISDEGNFGYRMADGTIVSFIA